MTIKEFILRAMEYDPITENIAQGILHSILELLGFIEIFTILLTVLQLEEVL